MKEPTRSVLRIVGVRRVSTEKQEREGESLRTQTRDIEQSVARLPNAKLVGWYGGQEHAMPGYEKREIDRLLRDASRPDRPFDAVMVAYADRWSRDNGKSHEGLEVFRRHGVRFFVGGTEYDLFKPEHVMFLEMAVLFGQFSARQQNLKSIDSRIARARRGIPTCGKLPYGRVWDSVSNQFKVDDAKRQIIEDAARRYLAGQSLSDIAREYGMNHSNLHKVLMTRCGTEWAIEFNSASANVHEVVSVSVPRLLDDETIRAVRARADANRTFTHGQRGDGQKYLLSRMIFCAHCGYAMFGQTNAGERRYYRHAHAQRDRRCEGPKVKSWIPADEVEDVVLRHLFETFGNAIAVQRAIEAATPDASGLVEQRSEIERLTQSVERIQRSRKKFLQLVESDVLSVEDAKAEFARLKGQEEASRARIGQLQEAVSRVPTKGAIEAVSRKIVRQMADARLIAKKMLLNEDFDGMTWRDRRALLQLVFGGKLGDGRRMGVYVSWDTMGHKGQKWHYSVHGRLIDQEGWLPMPSEDKDLRFTFGACDWKQRDLVTSFASHSRGTTPRESRCRAAPGSPPA